MTGTILRTSLFMTALTVLPATGMAADISGQNGGYKDYGYTGEQGDERAWDLDETEKQDYAGTWNRRGTDRYSLKDYQDSFQDDPDTYSGSSAKDGTAFGQHYNGRIRSTCLRPREVRHFLQRQGWRKFRRLRIGPFYIRTRAMRPNGLRYRLKIDRCTGVTVKAALIWRDYQKLRKVRQYGWVRP